MNKPRKKWIITDDGEKLFYDEKSGGYVEITLSTGRINQLITEAIEQFNRENRPVRRKPVKADRESRFHNDDFTDIMDEVIVKE